MEATLYPLAASKILRHCEIFLSTMEVMENEEIVELAFNEFVASADRTIQYLQKEINKFGGAGPSWFRKSRDNLRNIDLFYQLRHIIAHHFFIPLTPIIYIHGNVPEKKLQVTEYRLDLELLPEDKKFDKKRSYFIKKLGPSINAVRLCSSYFKDLSMFIKEAEDRYGNKQFFLRNKVISKFRVNQDFTLSFYEREY